MIKNNITIPNVLTLIRIILVPFIVTSMVLNYWIIAGILFSVAMITDVLDGAIARIRGEQTFLGACLDPIADKILTISCYTTLAFVEIPVFKVPLSFVYFVLIKEILLVLGAFYLGLVGHVIDIKPTFVGKAAAVIQTCFIAWLISCMIFHWVPIKTYYFVFYVVLASIGVSFLHYAFIGYKGLLSWLIKDYH
ncbi:CDP-alcohol phosphatidyltransferase family protein [Candidatus Dependentiae bacterium]|nr:CDP-alcohol phosphatidyltransferase family protein [Candidatus Dependentiae bacterium]